MHPEAKTLGDVMQTYTRQVTGEEPKGLLKGTAIAGGIGASYAATPGMVSQGFKGLTRLGKATPIYKSWKAQQIPKFLQMLVEHKGEAAERAERAVELGKSVKRANWLERWLGLGKKKPIEQIARDISSRTGTKITSAAVAKRLKQIESGGITARPGISPYTQRQAESIAREASRRLGKRITPEMIKARKAMGAATAKIPREPGAMGKLAEPIKTELATLKKGLLRHKLLAEETIFTKLSRKRIAELTKQKDYKIAQALAKKYGFEIKFTKRSRTVGGAAGVWDYKRKIIRVATGGHKPEDIARTLSHEITHKLHGDIAESMALQMTKTGKGKYVKHFKELTDALMKERDSVVKTVTGLDYQALPSRGALGQQYFGKPTEVLARVGEFIRHNPEKSRAAFPETYNSFMSYISKDPTWRKFFGSRQLIPLDVEDIRKIRTAIKNPTIEKLLTEAEEIQTKIWLSEHLGGKLYAPRMYRKYEEVGKKGWPFAKYRLRRPYAKRRGQLPFEARKSMGEITDIGYPETKRMIQMGTEIETAKLFKRISLRGDWVSFKPVEGFKQIPKNKAFGALSGRYVAPQIHRKIAAIVDVKTNGGRIYDASIGMWKSGKVLWSPSTHFRNFFSNSILNDVTGTDHLNQLRLASKLRREIKANSGEWQIIKKYLLRTGLSEAELMDDLLMVSEGSKGSGTFVRFINGFRKISSKPGKLYSKEEMFGKAIKYLHQREKGVAPMEAVKEATRVLFDYGDITAFEKRYMRRIMPFYTFPRKAIPVVVQAMRDNPLDVAKYPIMFWGMQQYSLSKLDMTERDYEQLAQDLPEYMGRGSYLLLPYRDNNGDLRFFDWTFILPWGEMAEFQERGPLDVVISNPLLQIVGDIARNKSSFTDREIWQVTDTTKEKTAKKMLHVWRIAVPSLAPKGLYWDKLYEAAAGTPQKYPVSGGKERLLPETVAHTLFGLRTQAVDPKQQKLWRFFEKQEKIKELSGKLRDIAIRRRSGNISEQEYQTRRSQSIEQIKYILNPLPPLPPVEDTHNRQEKLLLRSTR
jgi:hypothetical protein